MRNTCEEKWQVSFQNISQSKSQMSRSKMIPLKYFMYSIFSFYSVENRAFIKCIVTVRHHVRVHCFLCCLVVPTVYILVHSQWLVRSVLQDWMKQRSFPGSINVDKFCLYFHNWTTFGSIISLRYICCLDGLLKCYTNILNTVLLCISFLCNTKSL